MNKRTKIYNYVKRKNVAIATYSSSTASTPTIGVGIDDILIGTGSAIFAVVVLACCISY